MPKVVRGLYRLMAVTGGSEVISRIYIFFLIVMNKFHRAAHSLKSSHSAFLKIACLLYGTRSFTTVFTNTSYRNLSWASRLQFAPSMSTSLRSVLILSFHLPLGLPSGLLPSGLSTKTLYKPLLNILFPKTFGQQLLFLRLGWGGGGCWIYLS